METWLANNWAIIITVITLIFYIGLSYSELKQKISRNEAYKIAQEESCKLSSTYYLQSEGKALNQLVLDLKKDIDRIEKKLDTIIDKLIDLN